MQSCGSTIRSDDGGCFQQGGRGFGARRGQAQPSVGYRTLLTRGAVDIDVVDRNRFAEAASGRPSYIL